MKAGNRTALQIARILHDYGSNEVQHDAAEMLRLQHAEIERLTAINSALTAKSNSFVIENARQARQIDRLTAEKFRRFNNEECWIYQRNGENHLGTLTCPVVISPEALLSMQGEISILTAERDSYRELVNTLTKIAREYGNTQQLRERIAHALPFDCDVIDAPCVEDARAMGQQGGPADATQEELIAEALAEEALGGGFSYPPGRA